jgi:hypothetical protein
MGWIWTQFQAWCGIDLPKCDDFPVELKGAKERKGRKDTMIPAFLCLCVL